jgi:ubiquinone/menaquinone biosynthesis C-methylase UbiE
MIRQLFIRLRQAFRRKRYGLLDATMGLERQQGLLLDLGGGPASFFAALFPRAEQIVLLDLDFDLVAAGKQRYPSINALVANAEQLPFADGALALSVCNSVIEHVANPASLANEIRRVSRSYFLQTPNGEFPVETHSLVGIPFYRSIPWGWARALVCRIFRANFAYVESVRYCPEEQLRALFPEASLAYERLLGLKKSFYLIHKAGM